MTVRQEHMLKKLAFNVRKKQKCIHDN